MQIRIITEVDEEFRNRWNKFVLEHPKGNFFQSPVAYKFFNIIDNYEPIFIVAKEKDEIMGSLLAVCIREGKGVKGYFSRRCIIWGGPVVKDNEPAIVSAFIDRLNQIVYTKTIYTEFRNLFDMSSLQGVFSKAGYDFEERINYIVEIESVEKNRKKLNKTRRWEINKGINEGAVISVANNLNDVYVLIKAIFKFYNMDDVQFKQFKHRAYESSRDYDIILNSKNKLRILGWI